jgi:hypothetical protein
VSTKERIDLDALLAGWPAPGRDEPAWEARADAIVKAALDARSSGAAEDGLADLLSPPSLVDDVPGGGDVALLAFPDHARVSAGEVKMSDGNADRGSGQPSEPPRKKQSLKEIAARASQSGRTSMPGSAPPPSFGSTPPSRPSLSTPVPSVTTPIPASRPVEAGADDSGRVDLAAVNAAATPEQVAAAEKAKPASVGLLEDDDKKPASAPAATQRSAAAPAPAAEPQKKGGLLVGVAIAAIGIAAAIAIVMRGGGGTTQPTASQEAAPPATATAVAAAEPTAAPSAAPKAEPTSDAIALSDIPSAEPSAAAAPGPAAGGNEAPTAAPAAADTSKVAAAAPSAAPSAKPAAPTGTPGDLASAMAAATGADKDKKDNAGSGDTPTPAAASRSSNIPEQPPQGSVSAAVGSVIGGAKGCVAGADDVSRATITFGSSGAVSSVSVTGWAAGKGAASCIKSALKAANVGPFQKSSYSVGVTIRP